MFAKLFSSITESSLWSEPKEVRLLFVTMLAKANQIGFVEASIPGLARVANLSVPETESALEVLMSPDKYSKNPENEGRRVIEVPGGFMLLNYEGYRARRSEEERREYMREYMRDRRKQSVNNVNICKHLLAGVSHGKPPLAQAETEADAETEARKKEYPADFLEFWDSYPPKRRNEKKTAFTRWKSACKKIGKERLLQRCKEYAASPVGRGEYVKSISVWLSKESWDDSPEAWGLGEKRDSRVPTDQDLRDYHPGKVYE